MGIVISMDVSTIYKELLSANAADETAAIGLASNLLHQQRSSEARDVVDRALTFHPNSLRLQEYKDRIDSGHLGGEERELVVARNLFEMDIAFIRDTAGIIPGCPRSAGFRYQTRPH